MKIYSIQAGYFKLDGGAMFGVVPKQLWNRLNPADDNNMCTWATRCLLVDDGSSVILFDTGMGDKQDEKFRSHFEPHGPDDLLSSLANVGYKPEDITDVFLTHLHFDHVGGACKYDANGNIVPTFPNATYWSNEKQWNWAVEPNFREKASFLKENFVPLAEQGIVKHIPVQDGYQWRDNITVDFVYGHTEAMMIPTITLPNGAEISYAADLLPSSFHTRMPYVMSYDIRPLETLKEKQRFFDKKTADNQFIFFEHDPVNAIGRLTKNDRGRFGMDIVNFEGVIG